MLPDYEYICLTSCACWGLNAPAGAWCSLTGKISPQETRDKLSQCTYRCVVLPDATPPLRINTKDSWVSMHLQVRGAP